MPPFLNRSPKHDVNPSTGQCIFTNRVVSLGAGVGSLLDRAEVVDGSVGHLRNNFGGKMYTYIYIYIYYVTVDDTERRQGVELRAECSVRSVPPWHSYIILYRD